MRRRIFALAFTAIAALAPWSASAGEHNDKATAQHIAAMLRDSGKMQDYSVGVKYKAGTVWLAGRVTSDEQMATALQVVSDMEGVNQIVNNMTVKQTPAGKKKAGGAYTVQYMTANGNAQASPIGTNAMPGGPGVPAGYRQLEGQGQMGQPMAMGAANARPIPAYSPGPTTNIAPAAYDQPHMPNYAWPSYAASPNYAAVTYPKQYSATAWPFIGPFYPYPQVPLGWRKVSLEWDDGWWFLDFDDRHTH